MRDVSRWVAAGENLDPDLTEWLTALEGSRDAAEVHQLKTAAALLNELDSLDEIFRRLDDVSTLEIRGAKSLQKKLGEQREIALLSRQLATVATDAPALADLGELRLDGADPELVDPLFEELGFGRRIRDRIQRWV